MSIKKSLRLSILLMSSLPLIFMAVLAYVLSYNKYLDLAKSSATTLAKTYAEGFESQISVQAASLEGLANTSSIQNIVLERYNNGVTPAESSPYYESVKELLRANCSYMNETINYSLYDLDGYFIASSNDEESSDWFEYMDIDIESVLYTTMLKSSNINRNNDSIDLITPIRVKGKIIGLIRADISSDYFGAFMPENNAAFILTSSGDYLFGKEGFKNNEYMQHQAYEKFNSEESNGYLSDGDSSINAIYGYATITTKDISKDSSWIYIIKQNGSTYQKILATLPFTFTVTILIILVLGFFLSNLFSNKYTSPILILKDNMTEAAEGNLNVSCNIHTNDEFEELSDHFNTMMTIISDNYKELEESKKAIEENEKELKKSYADIEKLAYHDGLTGLYNRIAFLNLAQKVFDKDGGALNKHAVFFIDLDNFKNVNDTLGHDYGDMLLIQVSNQLLAYTSDDDILARTGGDEFLIFKSTYDTADSLAFFAKQLVDIANNPFDLNGETAHISMSVGISTFPRDGLTINELIKNADIAMYSAKNSGKNNFRFFNSYMEDDFNRKNEIADILSKVIENNEVYLMYQPQVSVTTGKVTGYEALMRIESEAMGYLPPTEFIPIAEDSGIINQLGEWALFEACTFNNSLNQAGYGPFKVSVNVSTTQLQDNRLMEAIKSIPERTGMPFEYLEIEITESVLMNSFEHNLKLINEMKSLGISIALDDFGTGYSSFNYLTQIPIDTLKIDKSFIDGICNNEKDKCISDSIINLAHKMNISVVAEGVEDVNQLSILQAQLCDTLQGYLFSRPLKDTQFIELISKSETTEI